MSSHEDITTLLGAHGRGDPGALDRLLPLVYDELHRLADRAFGSQRPGHTLQPTAVVHEAWLKLARGLGDVSGRQHFYAVAAKAMRQVLANHAASVRSRKRGDGLRAVTLHELGDGSEVDLVALDDALRKLAELNPRHARVVELRFLAGLTIPEAADAIGVSHGTVESDWAMARAWLGRELGAG